MAKKSFLGLQTKVYTADLKFACLDLTLIVLTLSVSPHPTFYFLHFMLLK